MKSNIAVEIEDVSIIFNMSSGRIDGLKEYFVKLLKGELFFQEFRALENVSFSIKRGEVFGLIGSNGAGKSTMLKVIAGVLKPVTGKIKVDGSMAPLIELGAGFNYELTGRENIYLNGAILGHPRKFMAEKFDKILEFSELGQFIDTPMKNYSSGMIARLAFSIATLIDPEILIVDEVLAVGDFRFQEKCMNRIRELFASGTTVIIVSHTSSQIEEICDRVVWLEKGRIREIGNTKEVMERYKAN